MDRDAEIAETRRELDLLRARHSLYAKCGRVLKAFFGIVAPVTTIVLAVTVVPFGGADPVMAGFGAALLVVVCAAVYLITNPRGRINLASPLPRFGYLATASLFSWRASDASTIEGQIAERERRLTKLGVDS
ncbi:MAG TPA: hypothetical protein VIJ67_11360 [Pseudolabrys sp.]